MCGSSLSPLTISRSQNPTLHGRLAGRGELQRESDARHSTSALPLGKPNQEQLHAFTERDVSGAGVELGFHVQTTVAGTHSISHEFMNLMSRYSDKFHTYLRLQGFHHPGSVIGATVNESL